MAHQWLEVFVHAYRVQAWDILIIKLGLRNAFVRAFLRASKHKIVKQR
jgi:hypothetical protein